MITGVVISSREAVLSLILSAADNAGVEVEAVIDTGFDGFLTLPARLIEDLDLALLGRVRAALGDGSEVAMAGFEATVLWDGERRDVFVLEADGVPLVGMAILLDHRLTMDVEPDGVVHIAPLAPRRAVPVA